MKPIYWALIVLLGAIWGCSFYFNAILIEELSPAWVSAGRVTIGALGCWAYVLATGARLPRDLRSYGQLFVLGMLNYAIPFMLFPYAEHELPSAVVGVLNGLTPMTTLVVSQFWTGGDRATWNKVAGAIIGFAGVALLASSGLSVGAAAQLLAIGACLLATLFYAFTLNYAKRLGAVRPATVAASSLTWAAIATVPFAFATSGVPVITQADTWAALFAIGLLSSSVAFLLLWWLLPRVGPTNLSLNTFISPISAILLGVIVLHEHLTLVHMLGMIVILVGLVFMDGRLVGGRKRAAA